MRVGLLLGTSTGGVGQHVRSLVERLPGLGARAVVLGPLATDETFHFSGAGAEFRSVPISARPRLRADAATIARLRRLLGDVDVVHAHGLRAAAFAGLALGRRRPGRLPLVATWHNAVLGSPAQRLLLAGLERLAARRADITLGASSDLVLRASQFGAPDARLAPVAAPQLRSPMRTRDDVRTELGVTDRVLVLAVGRLAPQKDYPTLLRAARRLMRDPSPSPLIVVAGGGPLRFQLQAAIDADHLPVRLLGHRSDVPELLAAADIYVLTSEWEARALVIQEAMRAGVPVVATAVGGIPELVGDAALLVPPGDDEAVAREVRRLATDAALRSDYATKGRLVAQTWPDEDDTARHTVSVYAELLGH